MLKRKSSIYFTVIASLLFVGFVSTHIHLDQVVDKDTQLSKGFDGDNGQADNDLIQCNQNSSHHHCSAHLFMSGDIDFNFIEDVAFLYSTYQDRFFSKTLYPPSKPPKA